MGLKLAVHYASTLPIHAKSISSKDFLYCEPQLKHRTLKNILMEKNSIPLTLRRCETHPGDGTCAVVKEELWQQESLIFFAQRKSLTIAERRVRRRQPVI
jgi:hypothetical protein